MSFDLSELLSVVQTLRARFFDSDGGLFIEAMIALYLGGMLAWKTVTATGRGVARWWQGPIDNLCRDILERVAEPGAIWDRATGEYLCANGLSLRVDGHAGAMEKLYAVKAAGRDIIPDLTVKEQRHILRAVRMAAAAYEVWERRQARASARAYVCGQEGRPLSVAPTKKV